ncbi:hydroxyethylthiazole kinase [Tuberibacillus sp. Marseille-P3662]|uniref:hydroxyethylthiazole kinase n=1 Tax=Tuberibacillus sp. Marseille-P3662 TaxID=1965358 RepID=UPI0020CB57E6|nr:hydroxyethylthiazole kinase [Tuberibacillus sp. Marseille-P3662]
MIRQEEMNTLCHKLIQTHPLVHHITNQVTVNDSANATLAVGASPVMADSPNEAAEMAGGAQALVLNIGTLNDQTLTAMLQAGQTANHLGIPVILDPVGVGATSYRRQQVSELLTKVKPTVICGNISEIKTLAGFESESKGVDAGDAFDTAFQAARTLSEKIGAEVAITGESDVIANRSNVLTLKAGHSNLAKVTGTGCMVSSIIASFAAVAEHAQLASIAGALTMGLAGELAAERLAPDEGIGTFRIKLMDAIEAVVTQSSLNVARVTAIET